MCVDDLFHSCSFEFSKYILKNNLTIQNYKANIELSLILLIDCHITSNNLFTLDLISRIFQLIKSKKINQTKFTSECAKLSFDDRFDLVTQLTLVLLSAKENIQTKFLEEKVKKNSSVDSLLSCYRFTSFLIEAVDTNKTLGIDKKSVISSNRFIINIVRGRFYSLPKIEKSSRKDKQILLLIEHIPYNPKTGAHLSQINKIIEGFIYKEINVLLLITYEKLRADFVPWRGFSEGLVEHIYSTHDNSPLLSIQANRSFNSEVAKNNISKILEFSPSHIIKFGGALESKVFDEILSSNFPYIYSQFNLHNTPDSTYDLYLANGKLVHSKENWFERPIPIDYRINDNKEFGKELRLVTVLGGERLLELFLTYTSQDIDLFLKILRNVEKWTFVGCPGLKSFFKTNELTKALFCKGKIVVIDLAPSLFDLYSGYDVFVMPPKATGGAGGAFMAASAGLVVISSIESDAANVLPNKYLINNFDELCNTLEEFVASPLKLTENMREIQEELLKRKPKVIVDKLLALLDHATENFSRRITNKVDKATTPS